MNVVFCVLCMQIIVGVCECVEYHLKNEKLYKGIICN